MSYRHLVIWLALLPVLHGCGDSDTGTAPATPPQAAAKESKPATTPALPADAGNWRDYNRVLAGNRYSPLAQINRDNVSQLQQAWTHPAGGQATPIVIDGVMYVSTEEGVAAVAADTGANLWNHVVAGGRPSQRGVAYWPGTDELAPRIFFMNGNLLTALDTVTGQPVAEFGDQGQVNTETPYWAVPTVYKNVVAIGSNTGEVPRGGAANPRAFDARTGEKLWEFHTVPQPGEVGHDSWIGDSWQNRSGVNIWAFHMTVDEERGILYLPIAGPAANYWGGDRPGNNLFANSVVAVEAETGKYIWHFQLVHHALWDSDMPSAPVLFDMQKDGVTIPALGIINKVSLLFILNRVTGEPIYEVEERPVPQGSVPEEWYSPTQPFPVKPPPLSRVSFNAETDMVTADDTTPEHVAACKDLLEKSGGMHNEGPFTPFQYHEDGAPPNTTIQFPGGIGGVNWGGPAADPTTSYLYMSANETSLVGYIEKKKPGLNYGNGTQGSDQPYDRASITGPGPYAGFNARVTDADGNTVGMWPCQKPPWASLVAVNARTGEIAWRSVLGLNESLPEGKQKVGGVGSAGPSVTAGGLVFIGATNDRRIRAFDSATGEELWAYKMEQTGNAQPISYLGRDGKQYIAISARNQVVAFALP